MLTKLETLDRIVLDLRTAQSQGYAQCIESFFSLEPDMTGEDDSFEEIPACCALGAVLTVEQGLSLRKAISEYQGWPVDVILSQTLTNFKLDHEAIRILDKDFFAQEYVCNCGLLPANKNRHPYETLFNLMMHLNDCRSLSFTEIAAKLEAIKPLVKE